MQARIEADGIGILTQHAADSPNYLFVDLLIGDEAKAGTFDLQLYRDGELMHTHPYELKEREWQDGLQGFDVTDVVYLITPDRFANGDPTNDVVAGMAEGKVDRSGPGTRHGGDLQGITDHLDYLDNLGFTALWPSPVLENDMETYSYHGYAITDYYAVDPRFGTLTDYRALADSLRARDMKLIMDQVVNHCGSGHWWMDDLPFTDWLNYQGEPRMTNHARTVHQDPYASQQDRDLMVKGWFVSTMPDLNQRNPFMARYLIQNSIWWIETLGLGGVRQDTYPYPYPDFMTEWTCRIMTEYPDFNIVGEEWSTNPAICAYWQQGKENPDGYRSCLKTVMDFPLQLALTSALNEPESWGTGLVKLYEALAQDFQYADPHNLMVFAENHDMDRLATQLGGDPAKIKMALTYLLTIRGIPQLYYGSEVLLDNDVAPGDHGIIRSDMPGGWAGDSLSAFTGQGLSDEQLEVREHLRTLLQWRKQTPVIAGGKTIHYAPRDGLYVYARYNDESRVLVALNKRDESVTLNPADYPELFESTVRTFRRVGTENDSPLTAGMTVAGKGAEVFELR
jgi:glycosidase